MAKDTTKLHKMIELKELTPEELKIRLTDAEDNLEALRFQKDAGQLPNTVRVRHVRRDIARLRTVIHEYDLGIRKPKGAVK